MVDREARGFRSHALVATGNTGKLLNEELGLDVERVVHGPEGGDLIIGGRVAKGEIEAVIFFRDPLTAQPHEPYSAPPQSTQKANWLLANYDIVQWHGDENKRF